MYPLKLTLGQGFILETLVSRLISIGNVAARTGLAVSAIRFYEETGLLASSRDEAGRRQFVPADIRRLSFVMIAQSLGFSLAEIRSQLDGLPKKRTPNAKDWERISRNFRVDIDARIEALQKLRNRLSSCIGCGCLSLTKCVLNNKDDRAAQLGTGPRYLLGDSPTAGLSNPRSK